MAIREEESEGVMEECIKNECYHNLSGDLLDEFLDYFQEDEERMTDFEQWKAEKEQQ
jgi:hypothetical protein